MKRLLNSSYFNMVMVAGFGLGLLSLANPQNLRAQTVSGGARELVEQVDEDEITLDEQLNEYRVSIDLKAVALNEFLEHVQMQLPTRINVVIRKGARNSQIPAMTLRNVSPYAVFNAVTLATDGEIEFELGETDEIGFLGLGHGFVSDSSVSVVNVSRILVNRDQKSLLSAIDIGLKMLGSSENNVELKLHEETQLLFIKGSQSDTKVIMNVVEQLGKSWGRSAFGLGSGGPGGNGMGVQKKSKFSGMSGMGAGGDTERRGKFGGGGGSGSGGTGTNDRGTSDGNPKKKDGGDGIERPIS